MCNPESPTVPPGKRLELRDTAAATSRLSDQSARSIGWSIGVMAGSPAILFAYVTRPEANPQAQQRRMAARFAS
jgi:hypothetical protein